MLCEGSFNLQEFAGSDTAHYGTYTIDRTLNTDCYTATAKCGYYGTIVFQYCLEPLPTLSPTRPPPAGGIGALLLYKTTTSWGVKSVKVENGDAGAGSNPELLVAAGSVPASGLPTSLETVGDQGSFVVAVRTAGVRHYAPDGQSFETVIADDSTFDAGIVRVDPSGSQLFVMDSLAHRFLGALARHPRPLRREGSRAAFIGSSGPSRATLGHSE